MTYIIELSFNFRKGDQSEGHTFYQLYTPGAPGRPRHSQRALTITTFHLPQEVW